MMNFILTIWHANGTTETINLGRWTQCNTSDVKALAFRKLETQMGQYDWDYVGDGWIEGNAKETQEQIRAFLSVGIRYFVL
jgi:hypothetical protein